jgi:hypothetical protein
MRPPEGAKGQGPPEAAGPSNGTRQRAVRGPCEDAELLGPPTARVNARSGDHVKMQRPRTHGATAAGEMK